MITHPDPAYKAGPAGRAPGHAQNGLFPDRLFFDTIIAIIMET
jgi:hypothetical protein